LERGGTPVEVVPRLLVVKRLYGWSYAQAEYFVNDSLVLRQFCRVYLEKVPDDTTLIRWANTIGPETLQQINDRVVQLAAPTSVTTVTPDVFRTPVGSAPDPDPRSAARSSWTANDRARLLARISPARWGSESSSSSSVNLTRAVSRLASRVTSSTSPSLGVIVAPSPSHADEGSSTTRGTRSVPEDIRHEAGAELADHQAGAEAVNDEAGDRLGHHGTGRHRRHVLHAARQEVAYLPLVDVAGDHLRNDPQRAERLLVGLGRDALVVGQHLDAGRSGSDSVVDATPLGLVAPGRELIVLVLGLGLVEELTEFPGGADGLEHLAFLAGLEAAGVAGLGLDAGLLPLPADQGLLCLCPGGDVADVVESAADLRGDGVFHVKVSVLESQGEQSAWVRCTRHAGLPLARRDLGGFRRVRGRSR
jgi:hypothetical protein